MTKTWAEIEKAAEEKILAEAPGKPCRRSMGGYRCTGKYAAEMTFENADGTASPISLADISCNECGSPFTR